MSRIAPVSSLRAVQVPPQNLDAEASVLSAILLKPDEYDGVAGVIQAPHFYADANRRIYGAITALREAGQPVDVVTVATWLQQHDRLGQVGGTPYIAQIIDCTPAVANALAHAKIIKDNWTKRRLIAICQTVAAETYTATDDAETIVALARAGLEELSGYRGPVGRTLLEIARVMGAVVCRVPTGIVDLDDRLGGGLRQGMILVVGGAPGAGKTTLVLQIAVYVARHGASVRWVAADEPDPGLVSRVCQSMGIGRAAAEHPDDEVIGMLKEDAGELDLRILDGGTLVEQAAAGWLANGVRVLVIDSLQTALAAASRNASSPRERVDALLAALRRIAAAGVIVIVTSELARGAYRSQAAADTTDPLAAAKESGGIEYAASVLLVLRSVAGSSDLVEVAVPKNRLGATGPMALKLDRERCVFHGAAGSLETAKDAARNARIDEVATQAIGLIRAEPGRTNTALRDEVGCSHSLLMAALRRLVAAGAVRDDGWSRKSRWVPIIRAPHDDGQEGAP